MLPVPYSRVHAPFPFIEVAERSKLRALLEFSLYGTSRPGLVVREEREEHRKKLLVSMGLGHDGGAPTEGSLGGTGLEVSRARVMGVSTGDLLLSARQMRLYEQSFEKVEAEWYMRGRAEVLKHRKVAEENATQRRKVNVKRRCSSVH